MWAGIILFARGSDGVLRVLLVSARGQRTRGWELPKGGEEAADSSIWATARREVWEEAGVWVSWRSPEEHSWRRDGRGWWAITGVKRVDTTSQPPDGYEVAWHSVDGLRLANERQTMAVQVAASAFGGWSGVAA